MESLKVGFAQTDITPELGINITGYFVKRIADGILDPIEANVVAIKSKQNLLLVFSFDLLAISTPVCDEMRKVISSHTGVSIEAIIISATHTHTGPEIRPVEKQTEAIIRYREIVIKKSIELAKSAIDDLKPAKMGWKVGSVPNVAFVRRFRMKDGSVQTNPGINNPEILNPIGDVDERVSLIRFDRVGAESVCLVNYSNHPDVIGGTKISADWPGIMRKSFSKVFNGATCLFINGAQGDINHINVNANAGDLNGLKISFDGVPRGYAHAHHIANSIVGAIMQIYDKVNYVDVDNITIIRKKINVPSNKASAKELILAHKYKELHEAGLDDQIPFKNMELTAIIAEAVRMVSLENAQDTFEMEMTGIALGNVAIITLPGEAFSSVGQELKKEDGWDLIIICGLTNGYEGYFPTKEAYDEGGYETKNSRFKVGVAELLINEGKDILSNLKDCREKAGIAFRDN